MQDATMHAAIFVATLLTTATLLAFALRFYGRLRSAGALAGANVMSLSEAARVACRQAAAERLAVARDAERQEPDGGDVAWFERSIRQVVPSHDGSPGQITRADLKRYMDWARSVE